MQPTAFWVLGVVTVTLFSPVGAALAADGVPCTCRYKGQDMQIGELVCAELPNGDVMMVCDRVLNNTSWKTVQQGCPVTSASPAAMSPING